MVLESKFYYSSLKKKILILLPDLKGGGAEKLHVNLANYWSSKGYRVKFILLENEGVFREFLHRDIKIIDLNISKFRKIIFKLPLVINNEKPDILLVAMFPLTSLSLISLFFFKKKFKIFISDHVNLSKSFKYELKVNEIIPKIIMCLTYRFADGIIAVSKGVRNNLAKLSGLNPKKIRVIYNPVIISMHKKLNNSKLNIFNLWQGNYQYRILSVGTLKFQKNHEALIKAFSMIPSDLSIKLIILGDGPLKYKLKDLIKELNQEYRIELKGFVIETEKYYSTATTFVLSSRWEGFANVLVEALKYNLPIISTDCDFGPNEILENGKYGILIPVINYLDIKREILKIISDNLKFENGYLRALDFKVDKIGNKYLEYFFEK